MGGGAKLEGLLESLARRFTFPLRLGTPRPIGGASEVLMDPSWSGPVGLVHWLRKEKGGKGLTSAKPHPLERALLQAKEWLAAYF